MKFTDSHCHLDFPELAAALPVLLQQCQQASIHQIIIPAVSPNNWQAILDLTSKYNSKTCQLLPCLGIHPWYLDNLTEQALALLVDKITIEQAKILAIGETGIDGVIAKEQNNLAKQQAFFQQHIELANQFNKPLIVHHRRSHQEVIQSLKNNPVNNGGVIHAFSGSFQQAKTYIDMGFKLGIGGTITYPRAEKTIKAVKRLPLSSLVLETDAPAMPLYGEQGKSNSPINLIKVFNCLAQIRAESPEEIAQALEQNISHCFQLSR